MVIDDTLPNFDLNENERENDTSVGELPNPSARELFSFLDDIDEVLWAGCTMNSKLLALSQLLNCMSECNMSYASYDRLISIVKDMLLEGEKLPKNFYRTKKMMRELGLGYQKIHACQNNCMLFYKEAMT